jgi:hypothetical protein
MRIKTASPDFNTAAMFARRERLFDKYVEPLRQHLGIRQKQIGPMIGLSTSHYSARCVSAPYVCPLDVLLLYATALEKNAQERGIEIPFPRPDLWAGE